MRTVWKMVAQLAVMSVHWMVALLVDWRVVQMADYWDLWMVEMLGLTRVE